MVTRRDITDALKRLGIESADTVLFHSSLRSFGTVDGGAETVIDGIRDALRDGTVVFPALVNRDFANAYRNWNKDTSPSDVGLISETFRRQAGVLRSDQATHSVTAAGKHAAFLTEGHAEGRGRPGIFGTTPFSHTSPWQKMYDLDGKVVLLGVTMVYNTFKHFVEYAFADDTLSALSDEERTRAEGELSCWTDMENYKPEEGQSQPAGVWFWNNGAKEQEEMQKRGLLRQTLCGNSTLTAFRIRDFYDFLYAEFVNHPDEWLNPPAAEWVRKYRRG